MTTGTVFLSTAMHYHRYQALREAWKAVIEALKGVNFAQKDWPEWGETSPEALRNLLITLARLADAPVEQVAGQAMLAFGALRHYPMPACGSPETADTVWEVFFLLVDAVRVDWPLHMRFLSTILAKYAETDEQRTADWWLQRARAYAPLTLPRQTRV